jgi:hypothetical protein
MIIEGTIVNKLPGQKASFEGNEQEFVACTIARLNSPEVQSEVRIFGNKDIDQNIGEIIRLEVIRTITDRKAGIVRFDCKILPSTEMDIKKD